MSGVTKSPEHVARTAAMVAIYDAWKATPPAEDDYAGDCCDAPGCPVEGAVEIDGDWLCCQHGAEREEADRGGLPGAWSDDDYEPEPLEMDAADDDDEAAA